MVTYVCDVCGKYDIDVWYHKECARCIDIDLIPKYYHKYIGSQISTIEYDNILRMVKEFNVRR